MRFLGIFALLALTVLPAMAQDKIDGFAAMVYRNPSGESMPYRLFVPSESYDKSKKYPLVIWLHGAGGAGNDNRLQIVGDQILGTHIWTRPENQAKHPTFVLVPQSPGIWADPGSDSLSPELLSVVGILNSVETEFSVDASRIYVTG